MPITETLPQTKKSSLKIVFIIISIGALLMLGAIGLSIYLGVSFSHSVSKSVNEKTADTIDDSHLLTYAKSDFDKQEMMGKDYILGINHGAPVKVFFPCADICPLATIRIIRYDVNLSECKNFDGQRKKIYVPTGISMTPKEYCFPRVIVENEIYSFIK